MDKIIKSLFDQAVSVRRRAYAPYSGFTVGAALRAKSGRVFVGCNVENISFGLTICAERVCVAAAVAAGEAEFETIVVVADSSEPVMPCGACRQVLSEFAPTLRVVSSTTSGRTVENDLSVLLPASRQGILG